MLALRRQSPLSFRHSKLDSSPAVHLVRAAACTAARSDPDAVISDAGIRFETVSEFPYRIVSALIPV